MNLTKLLNNFKNIFDSEKCTDFLRQIYANDRLFSFDAFERTAYNCARIMKDAGLDDIEMLPVRADGKTPYGDWVIPQAWNAESAVLKTADGEIILADYASVPCSLAMYSGAADIIADCVDETAADLHGKILFTSKPIGQMINFAVESGAVGIISDFIPLYKGVRDDLSELRDVSRWDNSSFSHGNHGLFGFSISPGNGKILRDLIKQGKSALRADVKTKSYDGVCYTVSGKIKGETDDSMCIYGHLYEPGANDNASGCAVILELARCISEAINNAILPRPRLTINFVMGWECTGSVAWFCEKDRRSVCGFIPDMVGTDTIDNSHMCIWHAPMSNISFADYYIEYVIETYKTQFNTEFEWESKKFSIGTDNLLGDPYFSLPSSAMITEPALSYHSSFDSPERIQTDVIGRNGVIIGAYLMGLAAMEIADVGDLWNGTVKYINNTKFAHKSELLKVARQTIKKFHPEAIQDLIPLRKVAGCLTFESRDDLKDAKWQPAWSDGLNLPLYWADGKRNLWEIAVLSAEECGAEVGEQYKFVCEYFTFLRDTGYIELI